MCDFDDFGDDGFMDDEMVDDITSDEDDGFMDDEPFDDITSDQNETIDEAMETDADDCSGPGWEEIAFLGAMSEEIAEEKQRRERIRREVLGKDYLKSDFD